MSAYPRFEARISALERRQINTDARVEEVDENTAASVKQLTEDMETSFKQLTDYLIKNVEADITDIKATMATKADITDIKATMATKADITDIKGEITNVKAEMVTMENRILEAFKQMLTTLKLQ